MSKPQKVTEIEDVLSSIRRLVSEHPAPVAPKARPAAIAEPVDDSARLMLTPALRVTDPEDPWVPVAAKTQVTETTNSPDPDLDDGIDWADSAWGEARLMAHAGDAAARPEAQDPVDAEAEVADVEVADVAEAEVEDVTEAEVIEVAEAEVAEVADADPQLLADEWESAETPEAPAPVPHEGDPQLEADEWAGAARPDLDDQPDATDDQARSEHFEDALIAELAASTPDQEFEQELEASGWPDDFARAAALEVAAARAAQSAARVVRGEQPSVSPTEATVGAAVDPIVVEDAVPEPEETILDFGRPIGPDATDGGAMVDDLGERSYAFPDLDDGVLDEETLREIIADVVREELQGALGQRITRNVRKLVRREIRLALAADELD